ncbi:MAG: thioredoxin family protein [Acidobacteria bacterium]|nr:thioredoxin family protein [Acidobacteriota bacterium]MBS1866581.1 thioredoxin family protein [Acidobacteriota bacterium]
MATSAAPSKKVVSHNEWLAARTAFLKKEKEFTRLRDEMSRQRRELPWEKVDKNYVFDGSNGKVKLADLFENRSQLIVYHFMLGPNWVEGCPSCSFLGDHFDGAIPHLNARDVTFAVISRAPLSQIQAFQKRMGWKFNWFSANGTDFNFDYQVSFRPEDRVDGKVAYNYSTTNFPSEEGPGASVFYKDNSGDIFHTYSTYGRGLDIFLGAYNFLDIAPKGRDEEGLAHTMAWVRHHDKYQKNQIVDAKAQYAEPAKVHDCCKKEGLA